MARIIPTSLKWDAGRTQRNIRFLLAVTAGVVALLVGLFVLDQVRLANRAQSRQLTRFQSDVARSGELLRDMETAQRGFLLTGQEPFLEPYRQAEADLFPIYTSLRSEASSVSSDTRALIDQYLDAADAWQASARASLDVRRQVGVPPISEVVTRGKTLFDALRARQQAVEQAVQARATVIGQTFDRVYPLNLTLLVLMSLAVLGALAYSTGLVQRIGQFAQVLQTRQDRVQAYNRVVTALNGPTEIEPLLQAALPPMLEAVGAQAGAIYLRDHDVLRPAMALGLDLSTLAPVRSGEGLPGAAIQQNRTIVVADLPPDTPYRINAGIGTAPPKSVVTTPLRFGSEVLGALSIASLNTIGDEDVQQLRLAASQLATALSNADAFEDVAAQREQLRQSNDEIARRLEESETLQEMGRELAKQRDLQPLLQLVCREAHRLLRADYAAVATQINREGATKWVAVDGTKTDVAAIPVFGAHQGIAGRVIDQGAPVVVSADSPDYNPSDYVVHSAEGMRASLGVPLFRKTETIGALIVGFRRAQAVSDEMIELSAALAAYASVAIENARLLGELSDERDLVRARARELEEKNREIERANRLKSEFVANMSHELRTPLNSILALSQILDDELDGPLNDEQHKQVAIIERNGQNLLRLINDILNLSKIEAGKLELLRSTFEVGAMLEAVEHTVLPLVTPKNIKLVIDAAPDLPVLDTDENKLKQVLLNLLSNAAKFTERGTITVRTRRGREVAGTQGATTSAEWVTFEVSDTGIGIAPDDLPTIWEEFQQVDGSLSRRYEGTGLGLAIVRRLVGLLGGEIVARSVLGEGSTFTLSVPVHLPGGTQVIEPDVGRRPLPERVVVVRPPQANKPLVLIVDDEPEVTYILEKYLRDDGYEIAVAQTGDAAIEQARALHPFAMTLDVMLPGRDGWEVIQELKADPQTADIPIIMLSMLDNRQLGYSLGAADYLVKPVSRNDLLERLAQLRNGRPLETVLVVDDDPIEQRVLATALRELGMQVMACADGVDALAWLDEHTPDVITLDLMMPGMDGFTVLQEIKHRDALRGVPVLIITAKEITADDRARLNSRISAIIEKGPRQRDDVLREVGQVLNKHRHKQAQAREVADG